MTVLEKLNVILNNKSPEGGEAIPLVDAFGISNHILGCSMQSNHSYTACAYIKTRPHAKKQAIYKVKRKMFEFTK